MMQTCYEKLQHHAKLSQPTSHALSISFQPANARHLERLGIDGQLDQRKMPSQLTNRDAYQSMHPSARAAPVEASNADRAKCTGGPRCHHSASTIKWNYQSGKSV